MKCECGCGVETSGPTRRWVLGHHGRLQQTKLNYIVDPVTGCWIWQGGTTGRDGKKYGHVSYKGVSMNAHRAAYLMIKGPIPDGLVPDHVKCDTLCINPDHMELVTNTENIRRGVSCKLTPAIVLLLRESWPTKTIALLAREFNLSESSVRRVVRRERWADVEAK